MMRLKRNVYWNWQTPLQRKRSTCWIRFERDFMAENLAERLGLARRHMHFVTELLASYVPGRPVWAFGSRTFGKARHFSDLDLAVGGLTPLPSGARMDLADAFDASMLPIEVDVIDLNDVDSMFRSRVEPDFLLVQDPDKGKQ